MRTFGTDFLMGCKVFSVRCNIYISRLCHDASLSVCPSVCDGSALAHYSQFRFQIPIPLYRALATVLLAGAVLLAGESSRAMLASARVSCPVTQRSMSKVICTKYKTYSNRRKHEF